MSFVACKDKKRRKRVEASGTLPRKTYYCPNPKCDAELILVDCDDVARSDHFRLKNGSVHIYNCEYATDDKKTKNSILMQETIVHESFHQRLWKEDKAYGDENLKLSKRKKHRNADNWSSCYAEIAQIL